MTLFSKKFYFIRFEYGLIFLFFLMLVGVSFGIIFYSASNSSSRELILLNNKTKAPKDIALKVDEGIALLKASTPLQFETNNNREDGTLTRIQIALAIYDKSLDKVFEKRYWIDEQALKSTVSDIFGSDIVLIPEDNSDLFSVNIDWYNGYNSHYDVNGNPNLIVVANKYLANNKQIARTQIFLSLRDENKTYNEIVYAPYSTDLHWPDIIEQGKQYLQKTIDDAYAELRINGVMARSSPEELVVDAIDQNILKNILITEQTDTSSLLLSEDGGKRLAERFLVIVGANKEWAYRYTSSSAQAVGIAQFIESTYENIVEKYPNANLIQDHNYGMADHKNAIKAMILLLDNDKEYIQSALSSSKINIEVNGAMLAAAYNGRPNRVINAIKELGSKWMTNDDFPNETSNYIEKYDMIDELNIF